MNRTQAVQATDLDLLRGLHPEKADPAAMSQIETLAESLWQNETCLLLIQPVSGCFIGLRALLCLPPFVSISTQFSAGKASPLRATRTAAHILYEVVTRERQPKRSLAHLRLLAATESTEGGY